MIIIIIFEQHENKKHSKQFVCLYELEQKLVLVFKKHIICDVPYMTHIAVNMAYGDGTIFL